MRGKPEFQIEREHVLEVLLNDAAFVFGRIWRIRNGVYREMGIVAACIEAAAAETHCTHWLAECYVSSKSYTSEMLIGLGDQLFAQTSCKSPFRLNVCFGERTDSRWKTYGQVDLPDDDE